MKAISGAIVILAGSVLWGSGTHALHLGTGAFTTSDNPGFFAIVAGAFLVVVGLIVLIYGVFFDRPRADQWPGRKPWSEVRREERE